MALGKQIHITIDLGELIGKTAAVPTPPVKSSDEDAILLRLSNKDNLNEEQIVRLTADVLAVVDKKIKAMDYAGLREFLKPENRIMFTPDMKDLISEKLKFFVEES